MLSGKVLWVFATSFCACSTIVCYQFGQEIAEFLRIPSPTVEITIDLDNTVRQLYQGNMSRAKALRAVKQEDPGPYLGDGLIPTNFTKLTRFEAQQLLYAYVTRTDYVCSRMERLGRWGDGGYHVCLQKSFTPQLDNCLVYSFGINNEWSFDEGIQNRFGCEVHSFDPSMNMGDHMHSEKIHFHNLGLWGRNFRNEAGWELKDLQTIMKLLNHTDRVIDYLKIDIEGAEWSLIEHIIQSGVHSKIKQMAIEIHAPRLASDQEQMSVIDYGEIFNGLQELNKAGFQKYLYHAKNNCCRRFSTLMPTNISRWRLCCYELFYTNKNVI